MVSCKAMPHELLLADDDRVSPTADQPAHWMRLETALWNFHAARSLSELEDAFHLVYRQYADQGYIEKNHYKTFFHFHSLLPHAWTFVATNGAGDVSGTMTLITDHAKYNLPADRVFGDQIDRLRKAKGNLGEVGMLGIDKSVSPKRSGTLARDSQMDFFFQIYKTALLHARSFLMLDSVVIMVHPRHVSFYGRLHFLQVGEVRTYQSMNRAPAALMYLDLDQPVKVDRFEPAEFHASEFAPNDGIEVGEKHVLHPSHLERFLQLGSSCGWLTEGEKSTLRSIHQAHRASS